MESWLRSFAPKHFTLRLKRKKLVLHLTIEAMLEMKMKDKKMYAPRNIRYTKTLAEILI